MTRSRQSQGGQHAPLDPQWHRATAGCWMQAGALCFLLSAPSFIPPSSARAPGSQLLAPRQHPRRERGLLHPSGKPHCPFSRAERAGGAERGEEAAPNTWQLGAPPGDRCPERAHVPHTPAGTAVPWGAHPSPDCRGSVQGRRAGRGQCLGPPPPPSSAPHGWARPPSAQ